MRTRNVAHDEVFGRTITMAARIEKEHGNTINVMPVPRGGIPVVYLLKSIMPNITIVTEEHMADVIVDDLIDSGKTMSQFDLPFFALFNKLEEPELPWLVFPWEADAEGSIENNIIRILQYIGEDPKREGLLETPARVIKSWDTLFGGYKMNVCDVFKTFDEKYNELVLMQDIELYSTCEHHMLPFTGRAHIAYIANGKVIGASKLARILEVFSRRLQVQERLGAQVVDALMEHLNPLGAACIIEAKHHCMCSRGVGKQHSIMKTSTMRGLFLEDSNKGRAARSELMSLLR